MVSNLTARGIQLQTLETYDGLGKQRRRLREALGLGDKEEDGKGAGKGSVGGEGDNNPYRVVAGDVGAADIEFIWRNWVEASERERVEGLEWMDEVEEWELLARHYCVAWGWREGQEQAQGGGEEVFEQWNRLPVQQAEE